MTTKSSFSALSVEMSMNVRQLRKWLSDLRTSWPFCHQLSQKKDVRGRP